MPHRLHQPSAASPEEERTLVRRTDENIRAMLNAPKLPFCNSRREMRAQAAGLAAQINEMEAARRRPHTWELLGALANSKAAYALLKWRLFRINNFPVEILQRIFMLASSTLSFVETSKTRVRIASVCSYWRSIALSMSKLWSIIPVTSTRPPFPLLRMCVQRARVHPLILSVDQRNRNWSGSENDIRCSPRDMQYLMGTIASFFDQVRQLVIHADTWWEILAAEEVLASVSPPPCQLQRLEFHRTGKAYIQFGPNVPPPPNISRPYRLFGGAQAPMLNHLVLDGVYIDFARSSFRNLRIFEMRKMPVEHMPSLTDFIPVLQESPYLEVLVFDGACPRLPDAGVDRMIPNWRPVKLMRLREFCIANLMPDYARFLLKIFTAPELRQLTLERLLGADFTPLVGHLVGCFPKVTTLTVIGLGTNDERVLAAWFRTMPLRILRVAHVSEQFFQALLYQVPVVPSGSSHHKQHATFVCPHLEGCEVLIWSSINFEAFMRFYAGRRQTLRAILIQQADLASMNPSEKAWLKSTGILRKALPGSRPE